MTPWLLAGGLAAAVGGAGWAYVQGRADGRELCQAQAARELQVAQLAADHAASAAAAAISRIRVRHQTIRQEVEREIERRVEYRECRHPPEQLQRINAALTGADRTESAGGGGVPASGAAR